MCSSDLPRFEARLLPEDNQEQFRDGKPQGAFSLGSLKEQVFKQGGIYDVDVTLLEEPEEPEAATE